MMALLPMIVLLMVAMLMSGSWLVCEVQTPSHHHQPDVGASHPSLGKLRFISAIIAACNVSKCETSGILGAE